MKQAPYIESKPIPNRYARGWHCLGLAQEFKDGKPQGHQRTRCSHGDGGFLVA